MKYRHCSYRVVQKKKSAMNVIVLSTFVLEHPGQLLTLFPLPGHFDIQGFDICPWYACFKYEIVLDHGNTGWFQFTRVSFYGL
jgi:hypothetical protein